MSPAIRLYARGLTPVIKRFAVTVDLRHGLALSTLGTLWCTYARRLTTTQRQ
eukprot:jgi/Phyca11/512187/fgenesh2_kg.PHYCAscaffold_481_\